MKHQNNSGTVRHEHLGVLIDLSGTISVQILDSTTSITLFDWCLVQFNLGNEQYDYLANLFH